MDLPNPVYTSNLSSKGALVDESLAVLREIDGGYSLDEVRERTLEQDLLQKTTQATRQTVWKKVYGRYLTDQDLVAPLAQMVTHSHHASTSRLVLFYEFCRSEPLLHDTVLQCVYPRYLDGFSGVSKSDVQTFFDELVLGHPEITDWSPQTRDKVVSNILSILRDFGLLEGTQRKTFARLYVPLPAFVYVLYRLRDQALTSAPAAVNAETWRLFLLEREDVIDLLEESTAEGHCTFKHQADVMDLDWTYPTLEACVEALTGQV